MSLDHKYLTEVVLGECDHLGQSFRIAGDNKIWFKCDKCGIEFLKPVKPVPSFSTPNGFELLRKRLCELGLWRAFADTEIMAGTDLDEVAYWEQLSPAEKSLKIQQFAKENEDRFKEVV